VQTSESSSVRDRRSTIEPPNQLIKTFGELGNWSLSQIGCMRRPTFDTTEVARATGKPIRKRLRCLANQVLRKTTIIVYRFRQSTDDCSCSWSGSGAWRKCHGGWQPGRARSIYWHAGALNTCSDSPDTGRYRTLASRHDQPLIYRQLYSQCREMCWFSFSAVLWRMIAGVGVRIV